MSDTIDIRGETVIDGYETNFDSAIIELSNSKCISFVAKVNEYGEPYIEIVPYLREEA